MCHIVERVRACVCVRACTTGPLLCAGGPSTPAPTLLLLYDKRCARAMQPADCGFWDLGMRTDRVQCHRGGSLVPALCASPLLRPLSGVMFENFCSDFGAARGRHSHSANCEKEILRLRQVCVVPPVQLLWRTTCRSPDTDRRTQRAVSGVRGALPEGLPRRLPCVCCTECPCPGAAGHISGGARGLPGT